MFAWGTVGRLCGSRGYAFLELTGQSGQDTAWELEKGASGSFRCTGIWDSVGKAGLHLEGTV